MVQIMKNVDVVSVLDFIIFFGIIIKVFKIKFFIIICVGKIRNFDIKVMQVYKNSLNIYCYIKYLYEKNLLYK